MWTSYSDLADWCFLLARTDPDAVKHRGLSAFAIRMDQPGVEQRPLQMINGITREFGEVSFDGARVPAADMIGEPGEGWRIAMTVLSHEREPQELGNASRYAKTVDHLIEVARSTAEDDVDAEQRRDLAWAIVEADMLRRLVSIRLSERLDGIDHGTTGSIDKLLMTQVEQAVGRAALSTGGSPFDGGDPSMLSTYLYGRAQSVMGGTEQIQKNLVATRILELPS